MVTKLLPQNIEAFMVNACKWFATAYPNTRGVLYGPPVHFIYELDTRIPNNITIAIDTCKKNSFCPFVDIQIRPLEFSYYSQGSSPFHGAVFLPKKEIYIASSLCLSPHNQASWLWSVVESLPRKKQIAILKELCLRPSLPHYYEVHKRLYILCFPNAVLSDTNNVLF